MKKKINEIYICKFMKISSSISIVMQVINKVGKERLKLRKKTQKEIPIHFMNIHQEKLWRATIKRTGDDPPGSSTLDKPSIIDNSNLINDSDGEIIDTL